MQSLSSPTHSVSSSLNQISPRTLRTQQSAGAQRAGRLLTSGRSSRQRGRRRDGLRVGSGLSRSPDRAHSLIKCVRPRETLHGPRLQETSRRSLEAKRDRINCREIATRSLRQLSAGVRCTSAGTSRLRFRAMRTRYRSWICSSASLRCWARKAPSCDVATRPYMRLRQ